MFGGRLDKKGAAVGAEASVEEDGIIGGGSSLGCLGARACL